MLKTKMLLQLGMKDEDTLESQSHWFGHDVVML